MRAAGRWARARRRRWRVRRSRRCREARQRRRRRAEVDVRPSRQEAKWGDPGSSLVRAADGSGAFFDDDRQAPRSRRQETCMALATDLADCSATTLLALYRAGTASPVEATRAVLDRIERVDPILN